MAMNWIDFLGPYKDIDLGLGKETNVCWAHWIGLITTIHFLLDKGKGSIWIWRLMKWFLCTYLST